ncbi:MAG: alpha/beta fold hydrolase [Albidovulum sp.]|uniref:alpha/beta fold hydrolase n=1 Tax=Albidovulum sp. TaxID=1872424 RepID=UPI003C86946E
MIAGGTAYDLTGPADAPVLVLIHGLGLTRATWADHVPVLARDYRVLSYDLCGHGETTLPDRTPSLVVLSDQLCALMDALDIPRATLIGFSLGGMINRRFAMDHPDRCEGLVILNSPHERTPEAQRLVEERAAATGAGGPAATIQETLERWFTPEFRASNTKVVNWVRDTVLANHPDNYTRHRQVLASGVVELIRPDPPIPHPTLVMTCENDTGSTPAMSQGIATEIEGAEVIIVPDLQHLGLLEEPQLFLSPILGFLGRIFEKD